jgi:prepilin-type N-terminal cleavage/methylation domain-containing protein
MNKTQNTAARKGMSLIELIVAIAILAGAAIPISSMFTKTTLQLEQTKKWSYANYIGHSILERMISSSSSHPLDKIPVHEEFLGLTEGSPSGVSPYFKDFFASGNGVKNTEFPELYKELKSFTAKVQLLPVDDLPKEKARLARVELHWQYGGTDKKNAILVLKTMISSIPSL